MSIPDESYSRNGYTGNSGDHKTSIGFTIVCDRYELVARVLQYCVIVLN